MIEWQFKAVREYDRRELQLWTTGWRNWQREQTFVNRKQVEPYSISRVKSGLVRLHCISYRIPTLPRSLHLEDPVLYYLSLLCILTSGGNGKAPAFKAIHGCWPLALLSSCLNLGCSSSSIVSSQIIYKNEEILRARCTVSESWHKPWCRWYSSRIYEVSFLCICWMYRIAGLMSDILGVRNHATPCCHLMAGDILSGCQAMQLCLEAGVPQALVW